MKRLRKVANMNELINEVQEIGVNELLDYIRSISSDLEVKDTALKYAKEDGEIQNFSDDEIEELEDYFFSLPLVELVIKKPTNKVEQIARTSTYNEINNMIDNNAKEQIKNNILNKLQGKYSKDELLRLNNSNIVNIILNVNTTII